MSLYVLLLINMKNYELYYIINYLIHWHKFNSFSVKFSCFTSLVIKLNCFSIVVQVFIKLTLEFLDVSNTCVQ